jgi:nicotinamidase-related amidase
MKLALLIIDMQKAWYDEESKDSMDSAAEYIEEISNRFRDYNLPIYWIYDVDEEDGSAPGLPDFGFIDSLEVPSNEVKIHKNYGNAFNKTNLGEQLAKEGVDTVIITGFSAAHCVLSTYRGALDLDLTPILIRGAVASADPEQLLMVEKISNLMTYVPLIKLLEAQK